MQTGGPLLVGGWAALLRGDKFVTLLDFQSVLTHFRDRETIDLVGNTPGEEPVQ